jgi:hypothetical protein
LRVTGSRVCPILRPTAYPSRDRLGGGSMSAISRDCKMCEERGIPCTSQGSEPEPDPMVEFARIMHDALADLAAWEAAQAPVPDPEPVMILLPPGASVTIIGAARVEVRNRQS